MRLLRVFAAAIFVGAALSSPVSANHETDDWWSYEEYDVYSYPFTRKTTDDSFRARIYMIWNSTNAPHQRTNQANGIKFTIDQTDFNHNVEAYLFGTTILNPYTDLDDDNGDSKDDEAEIVSESNSFPAANTWYYSSVRWSHSYTYYVNGNQVCCRYDPDGGHLEYFENLSTAGCPFFCDKWDTHCCNTPLPNDTDTYYPSNSQFAAIAPPESAPATQDVASLRVANGRPYTATLAADGDVHLAAQLGSGLISYARGTRELARTTSNLGPADGVVTFAYPLTWSEFLDFEALGVSVADLEFVTEPDANGLRVTYVMTRPGANPEWVDEEASEANVGVMGIVSANVTVPDLATLERLEASGYVYLVDLSIADFKRQNPGVSDVLQNDVYWSRAGWQ
ncbi:MAG: hypothetical protein WD402_07685 [Chloroflexota bacterium]